MSMPSGSTAAVVTCELNDNTAITNVCQRLVFWQFFMNIEQVKNIFGGENTQIAFSFKCVYSRTLQRMRMYKEQGIIIKRTIFRRNKNIQNV